MKTCGCCQAAYSVQGWPEGADTGAEAAPAAAAAVVDKSKSKGKASKASGQGDKGDKGGKGGKGGKKVDSAVYGWLCPTCAHSETIGDQVVGRAVKVWWKDDAQFYCGSVNAYDSVSGKHRVLYDDDEWEFIDLGVEPVLTEVTPPFVMEVVSSRAGRRR